MVSVGAPVKWLLALCILPRKLRLFLNVTWSAEVIMIVKRIEPAEERGYALYKCSHYYFKKIEDKN